jgi:predicted RNase H-like HicB family nuclease
VIRKFLVIATQGEDGYIAECPALPGCTAKGESRPQARDNIREAIISKLKTQQSSVLSREIAAAEVCIYDDEL